VDVFSEYSAERLSQGNGFGVEPRDVSENRVVCFRNAEGGRTFAQFANLDSRKRESLTAMASWTRVM